MATIDNPRAIRVKTSTGWADLVIQGPPGSEGPIGPEGPPGPGSKVSYGNFITGPPNNPVDGDEWFADVEDGVCWQFRYKANSPSPYKWEFVGGPSIVRTLQGYGAYQAAIWTPFNGLAWAAHRPGEYESSGSWSGYTAASVSLGVGTMMNYGGGYNNPPVYSYTTQAAAWYFMLSVPKYVVTATGVNVTTIAMGYWMSLAIAGTYAINHTIIPKRVG